MIKFVGFLDAVVWSLLVSVIATQSLQVVGIVEYPTKAETPFEMGRPFDLQSDGLLNRDKRQAETEDRSQFIDTLFNIPIKTLTAVNNLIQSSRPAIRKVREFMSKRFEKTTKAPDTEPQLQKRSYPVYVRPKDEKN
ncbi:uncharacterized protein LOC132705238 [Cylas formicarius]|uniref:uncharacterized protein LOC132705238 n=1 Tax=Cylas formicarius TaxID=197179 RepID=UPI0029584B2D|nr:uncharacterized protein LOC132705238 [Cylas formicarius]